MSKSNVISIQNKLPIEIQSEETPIVEVVKPRVRKTAPKSNTAHKMLVNFVKILGLATMLLGITSYLVYQNYAFFVAILTSTQTLSVMGCQVSIPAFLNSVVAELILLTAAAYTVSKNMPTKLLAWTLMVGMICGLGVFMHASIDNDLTGSSDYVQSLKQQENDAISAKDGYSAEKAALDPLTWKTRREALQVKINLERDNIAALDQKISEAKTVSSSNLGSIVIYNSLLRIAAMIVNALLAHTLIRRFVKP